MGSYGAGGEQAAGLGRLDIVQRIIQENHVRYVAGGLYDCLEPGARDKNPDACGAKLRFTDLAGRGVGVGDQDQRHAGGRN